MSPEIPSVSIEVTMTPKYRRLKLYTPKCESLENYDGITAELYMPALEKKEMRACAERNSLFIQGKTIKPNKITGGHDIMQEKKGGMLEPVTFPDTDDILSKIITYTITSFQDMCAKRCWAYYGNFLDHPCYIYVVKRMNLYSNVCS